MKNRLILYALAISFVSSATTAAAVSLLQPEVAHARQTASGIVLFAAHRRDTDNQQGFIFFDQKTGDIWVYDNQNPKEHYRVGQMGQPMQKLK